MYLHIDSLVDMFFPKQQIVVSYIYLFFVFVVKISKCKTT